MKPVSLTRITSHSQQIHSFAPSSAPVNASLCVGDTVEHERFGLGTIVSMEGSGNGAKAIVDFQGVGQKTLLLSFAKLKKVSR
jgi:DNA helicase-2/ATP-dependent DNA helicase PcrA